MRLIVNGIKMETTFTAVSPDMDAFCRRKMTELSEDVQLMALSELHLIWRPTGMTASGTYLLEGDVVKVLFE